MKVLVTGGAGFIGSHVVDALEAQGHEARIFDLVRSPYHPDVEAVVGDLTEEAAVREAVAGCDAVAHLAAIADVNLVALDPAMADRVNVGGTQTLLDAAHEARVGRFIYASTVWVYGDQTGGGPVAEEGPLVLPAHLYTATKLAGEMYCHSYAELFGLEYTILRFGIPHGPRARDAAVVPAFVARAREGEALTISGDGSQSRQFVYVRDLADGVVAALAPAAAGRIYNLVGDESISVCEIADTVREIVADVPIVHGPERPGDLRIGHVSGARAASELGWTAATTFAQGVRRYVDWLTPTNGSPVAATASSIAGSAAAVVIQDLAEL